jgi:hypothetical protein
MLDGFRNRKFTGLSGDRTGSDLRNELIALCNCIAVVLKEELGPPSRAWIFEIEHVSSLNNATSRLKPAFSMAFGDRSVEAHDNDLFNTMTCSTAGSRRRYLQCRVPLLLGLQKANRPINRNQSGENLILSG